MDPNEIKEVFTYLRVKGAADAIEFYKQAFGAKEDMRLAEPSGRIGHAQMMFGPTCIMLSDEYPEHSINAPQKTGGTGTTVHLHVANADAMIQQAVAAGATVVMEPKDHFHGERSGTVRDPFGHLWLIGHQIEKVAPEEMQRCYNAALSK